MLHLTNFIYCPQCAQETLKPLHAKGFQCTNCLMKYFHNTASYVGGLINTPKGLLLVTRAHEPSKGLVDLPGGFVEYNESLEGALQREIHEELNIDISVWNYFGSFPNVYAFEDITYFTTDVIFTATWKQVKQIKPNKEITKYIFADPHSVDFDSLAFHSTKCVLEQYLKREQ